MLLYIIYFLKVHSLHSASMSGTQCTTGTNVINQFDALDLENQSLCTSAFPRGTPIEFMKLTKTP